MLIGSTKKKGFLFLFAFLYSVRLNSFFIQSFALKKFIPFVNSLFNFFFFFCLLGFFLSQYYFTNYVNMSTLSTYIIVTLCSTYEILHDFKIWEGSISVWEQQCEHTINVEAYSHKRMLNHRVLKRHVCYFLQSST